MPASSSSNDCWLIKLRAAQAGDCVALGEILDEYWTPLWNQAKISLDDDVGRDQAASDLVQDTLVDAQKAIAGFRGQTRREFIAWLRTIMRNNLLEARRSFVARKQRQVVAGQMLAAYDHPDLGNPPVDRLISAEQQLLLERAIDQLPEHYQAVIRLRYWEAKTYDEIGQCLGKSGDSARQIWYRAIELVTEALKQHVSKGK